MQTYYINTLLSFFKSQSNMGYEGIEFILAILESSDEDIPEDDKMDSILFTLRRYGLRETTYKGGRFVPRAEEMKIEIQEINRLIESRRYTNILVCEEQVVNVLNGQIRIHFPLN